MAILNNGGSARQDSKKTPSSSPKTCSTTRPSGQRKVDRENLRPPSPESKTGFTPVRAAGHVEARPGRALRRAHARADASRAAAQSRPIPPRYHASSVLGRGTNHPRPPLPPPPLARILARPQDPVGTRPPHSPYRGAPPCGPADFEATARSKPTSASSCEPLSAFAACGHRMSL